MSWRHHFAAAIESTAVNKAALCRKLGINSDLLYKWQREEDDKGRPDIAQAIEMAKFMRMGLDELFRGVKPTDDLVVSAHRVVLESYEHGYETAIAEVAARKDEDEKDAGHSVVNRVSRVRAPTPRTSQKGKRGRSKGGS